MKNWIGFYFTLFFVSLTTTTTPGQVIAGGTGFAVAPGLIVTNDHVIDQCEKIEVIAADGKRPAVLVDTEPVIDLALLRVYGLGGAIAQLRTESPVLLGEDVMVFGFPLTGALSSTGNFTTGNVSSLRGLNDAAGVIQITAPVQPGNSGGPLLDDHGRVVGVVQSKLDAIKAAQITGDIAQNVNFGIALPVLIDFLRKNEVSLVSPENIQKKTPVEVARDAENFTYMIQCVELQRAQKISPPSSKAPPAMGTSDRLTSLLQAELNRLGYNAGVEDGLLGPRTRRAILRAQRVHGLPANGLPSAVLLDRLRQVR